MLIAITGPIASGKSTMISKLKEVFAGFVYIDLDVVCKEYKAKNQALFDTYYANNGITEADLAKVVFASDRLYGEFIGLFEPMLDDLLTELSQRHRTTFIIEASALSQYERLLHHFDFILNVTVNRVAHLRNLAARGLTEDIYMMFVGRSKAIEKWNVRNVATVEDLIAAVTEFTGTNKKLALFCGSFDPFTIGHLDIVKKAEAIFDNVAIVQARNQTKNYPKKYLNDITQLTKYRKIQSVDSIPKLVKSLITDGYKPVLVRGIRNSKDVEDAQLWSAQINELLGFEVECVLILGDPKLSHISSSFVRGAEALGENIERFIIQ